MPQARLTKTDIIDNVRAITEMDAADVSDSVIEIYLRDGYNRIIELERRWRFLECKFTLTTSAGVQEYTPDDFTADEIREVISIVDGDHFRLQYVDYDAIEELLFNNPLSTAIPQFYTFWDEKLVLFPIPNSAYSLTVRAYRNPIDWVTDDAAPDGSAAFDMALVYYAISRIYQAQEELNTAASYERMYADSVTLARRDLTRPPSAAPVVFAGGSKFRLAKGLDWNNW